MLVSYIYEVAKMDVEIALVLGKKQTVLLQGSANDIEKMKMGKIETDNRTVMFQQGSKERGDIQKCLFALPEKHLFSTTCLDNILEITGN